MILTPADNLIHIRDDKEKRMVGMADPNKGPLGTLVIKRGASVCEVDIGELLAAMGKKVVPQA